jgi:hypothetical protein
MDGYHDLGRRTGVEKRNSTIECGAHNAHDDAIDQKHREREKRRPDAEPQLGHERAQAEQRKECGFGSEVRMESSPQKMMLTSEPPY